ncbi:hypothetical protein IF2G_07432 [Cordyceps javanica]|nr:hypothetical protein IF2G_07432 [Cordyceps javanica]
MREEGGEGDEGGCRPLRSSSEEGACMRRRLAAGMRGRQVIFCQSGFLLLSPPSQNAWETAESGERRAESGGSLLQARKKKKQYTEYTISVCQRSLAEGETCNVLAKAASFWAAPAAAKRHVG